jgi:predicted molibdopterin-dependent oxidoreductase YjgC
VFDSPINLGAHCAKGAALREHGHGEYRLKYPMKLVDGKYVRIGWDQALDEISAKMLELRKQSGPDSVFIVGSSKHNNEQAYLLRKWVSLWGSNNCDHQARICHSTTSRRRQHLGLRRDDELVQRHAEREGGDVHRQQRRRGAPGARCCTCCMPRRPAAR